MTQFDVYSPYQTSAVQDPQPVGSHQAVPTSSRAAVGILPQVRRGADLSVAALAHFSVFFGWVLGPALVYAVSPRGTWARRQAARAFNFQMLWAGLMTAAVAVGVVFIGLRVFPLIVLASFAWFLLTVLGGIHAAHGEEWETPLQRVVPLRVLPEE